MENNEELASEEEVNSAGPPTNTVRSTSSGRPNIRGRQYDVVESVSEQNGGLEHRNDPDDDVVFVSEKQGDFYKDAFSKYRLQRQWDTEELVANMRAVGEILKISTDLLDTTANIFRESLLCGVVVCNDKHLSDFFDQVPVAVEVRTAIIKIMRTMGKKMNC